MIVRAMRPEDVEDVKRLHERMGIDYTFPDLSEAAFLQVIEQDGKVVAASMNRVVAETYLWIDPQLHPAEKWTAIRLGQQRMQEEAQRRGWAELIAMIPKKVEKMFQKRLWMLRWERQRDGWRLWGHRIPGNGAVR